MPSPMSLFQKYVISLVFILTGNMKRFLVSDYNLFCNLWGKKDPDGLFAWQHNHNQHNDTGMVPRGACMYLRPVYFSIMYSLVL